VAWAAAGWIVMLAAGLGHWLGETGAGSWLIPEPWNTVLFWRVGGGAGGSAAGAAAMGAVADLGEGAGGEARGGLTQANAGRVRAVGGGVS
jgi:hypothetical protein